MRFFNAVSILAVSGGSIACANNSEGRSPGAIQSPKIYIGSLKLDLN